MVGGGQASQGKWAETAPLAETARSGAGGRFNGRHGCRLDAVHRLSDSSTGSREHSGEEVGGGDGYRDKRQ